MRSALFQIRFLIAAVLLAAAVTLVMGVKANAQGDGALNNALNETDGAGSEALNRADNVTPEGGGDELTMGDANAGNEFLPSGFLDGDGDGGAAPMAPPSGGGGDGGAAPMAPPSGGGAAPAAATAAPAAATAAPAAATAAPAAATAAPAAATAAPAPTALPDTGGPSLLLVPAAALFILGSGLLTATVSKVRRAS